MLRQTHGSMHHAVKRKKAGHGSRSDFGKYGPTTETKPLVTTEDSEESSGNGEAAGSSFGIAIGGSSSAAVARIVPLPFCSPADWIGSAAAVV